MGECMYGHLENDYDDVVTNTNWHDDMIPNKCQHEKSKISQCEKKKLEACMAQWLCTISMRKAETELGHYT